MRARPVPGVMDLMAAEIRRALHRRAVWVLIAVALVGTVILGVVAYFDSVDRSVLDLRVNGTHPAVMADWWVSGGGDGILMIGVIPLLLGALIGGATVVGAEWRAGTVATLLTWEPRRWRLHAVRIGAVFALATLIALLLQVVFLSATLPAVLLNGTTEGTDAGWWGDLVAAWLRIGLLTGGAAVLGASLASIGRATTFALAGLFAWMSVGENLVRGLKPSLQHLLLGENLAISLTWAPLEGDDFTRSEVAGLMTVVVYIVVVALAAAATFARRDLNGTT